MKKQILSEEFRRMQKLAGIITEAAFNSDGEPLMTHNQYRDYNEPSEDEDYNDSNDRMDIRRDFINEMKKNDKVKLAIMNKKNDLEKKIYENSILIEEKLKIIIEENVILEL